MERKGITFSLIYATRSDPLYGHHPPDSDAWTQEVEAASTSFLLVGHWHIPFLRQAGMSVVLNPGSIGQPRSGDLRTSYSVWQDGRFTIRNGIKCPMRQIALRDFRLQGAKALGKLRPGEAVILSGRQGPAYFLIPVESESREAQEEELKTAMALAAMRESWRRAEAAGLADLTMDEIDAEIAASRKDPTTAKKRGLS